MVFFSTIFEALYWLKLGLYFGLNLEAEIQTLSTAALPGQTTQTALTEELFFKNVAYRV